MRVGRLADSFRPDESWQREVARLAGVGYERVPMDGRTSDMILGESARTFARRVGTLTLDRDTLLQPHVLQLFRGDNPELRPAVRLGLRSIEGDSVPALLAGQAAELLSVVPSDLDPARMPRAGDPEAGRRLQSLIELSVQEERGSGQPGRS